MTTITLDVASPADVSARVLRAFAGKREGARVSFATPELLWKVLTPKRWQLLQVMAGQSPQSIRQLARLSGRDVKAVHGDVHALLAAGVVEKTGDGRMAFPFDAIRVDFTLRAA